MAQFLATMSSFRGIKKSAHSVFWPWMHPPTHAKAQQDLKGYWCKVHEIVNRRRWINVDINAIIGVAIFPSVVKKASTNNKGWVIPTCHHLAPQNWLPWQRPLTEVYQILAIVIFLSAVLTQQFACSVLLRTPQPRLPMLFNGPDYPQNLPFPRRDSRPHLIHGSLGPRESAIQTASRSVQAFLQGSPACPTDRPSDRQTDRQTTLRMTSVAMGRIYAMHAIALKITQSSRK